MGGHCQKGQQGSCSCSSSCEPCFKQQLLALRLLSQALLFGTSHPFAASASCVLDLAEADNCTAGMHLGFRLYLGCTISQGLSCTAKYACVMHGLCPRLYSPHMA